MHIVLDYEGDYFIIIFVTNVIILNHDEYMFLVNSCIRKDSIEM